MKETAQKFSTDPNFTKNFDVVILHGSRRSYTLNVLDSYIRNCLSNTPGQLPTMSSATWTTNSRSDSSVVSYKSSNSHIFLDLNDNSNLSAIHSFLRSITATKPFGALFERHRIIIDGPERMIHKIQPIVKHVVEHTPGNVLFIIVWSKLVGLSNSFSGLAIFINCSLQQTDNALPNYLEKSIKHLLNSPDVDTCYTLAKRLTERQVPTVCIALCLFQALPPLFHHDISNICADADAERCIVGRAITAPYSKLFLRILQIIKQSSDNSL